MVAMVLRRPVPGAHAQSSADYLRAAAADIDACAALRMGSTMSELIVLDAAPHLWPPLAQHAAQELRDFIPGDLESAARLADVLRLVADDLEAGREVGTEQAGRIIR